jgi:hypothetical protein
MKILQSSVDLSKTLLDSSMKHANLNYSNCKFPGHAGFLCDTTPMTAVGVQGIIYDTKLVILTEKFLMTL